MRQDKATLLDIARIAQEILDLTKGMDEATFAQERPTQLAILYEIAVLGEAVKRLSPQFRERYQEIPWKEIAGMRDKVIHRPLAKVPSDPPQPPLKRGEKTIYARGLISMIELKLR